MVHILVVDDHPLFRDGFAYMVRVLRPDWRLQFADSSPQALAVLARDQLDLAIVDANLPGEDGFSLVKAIADISNTLPQILISGREDAAIRMRARACGVSGFIAKTASPDSIVRTIETILSGGTDFDTDAAGNNLPDLTSRQIEVLMLLAEGHGNKEIRHRLKIAERTVRAHLTELFQVLGAHSRMQAVVRARELGLIA